MSQIRYTHPSYDDVTTVTRDKVTTKENWVIAFNQSENGEVNSKIRIPAHRVVTIHE